MSSMDTDRLKELAPHYAAMFLLVFLILIVVQLSVGEVSFWVDLAIVLVVVYVYRPVVIRLGMAPRGWE